MSESCKIAVLRLLGHSSLAVVWQAAAVCPIITCSAGTLSDSSVAAAPTCLPQVVSKLHQILKPFLLRRVKTDVETSLPGKMEVRLGCEVAGEQSHDV
jgi:hypothetical protein